MVERKAIEKAVEDYALQFLVKGREDWDIPHTKAVVFYAEKLAEASGLDVLVFTTVARLHDVGYYGLFDEVSSGQYANISDRKALHMVVGAKIARQLLESASLAGCYTAEQIEQIVHLVGIHDDLKELQTLEEFVFMEADTLGAIDLARVVPTFDRENGLKYIASLKKRRMSLFTSELGKEYLEQLLPKFETYFREMVVS